MKEVDDLRITAVAHVDSPEIIQAEIQLNEASSETVAATRQAIQGVLHNEDDRLVVIVGPCSIHDPKAALEYAEKLQTLKVKYADELIIVMRVYFEKPRTTIGWKGLMNDPDLNETFDINKGVRMARQLLQDLNNMGLPTATEFLDLISPQYIADLISWGAIGARTTESQGHRELASGLSCPVGFKNGTNGNLQIAIDAIGAASKAHHFLSLTKEGRSAAFTTSGNEDCHIILRGGVKPNYDTESVHEVVTELKEKCAQNKLMIDFSHANSNKDYKRQVDVCENVSRQIASGNAHVMGVMIESHLVEGNQNINAVENPADLTYGQSITDGCVGWDQTETMLADLSEAVKTRRA